MAKVPPSILAFLAGDPIAVAGVSRAGNTPANAIFRKLRDAGHQVIPINPNAAEIDALEVCRAQATEPIVGGCPLMYCQPVDLAHRCFR